MVDVVLACQRLAQVPITRVVVNGRDFKLRFGCIIAHREQAETPHQFR